MDATDWVSAYWAEIEAGSVVVCKKTRAVYGRLAGEIAADVGRWTFDPARGNRPIGFIEAFCRHSKGDWAGKPVRLETWQKAFVCALFGFIDRETGERRFTEALLCIGRKGGKSTLAACILLYLFVAEGQADVFTAATKLDQASLIFEEALHMVEQSPYLRKRIRKRRSDMYIAATRSKFKPLGRNSNTMDGLNASAICVDELHGLDGANGRNLYEVLKQSQSARASSVFLMTTTAGTVRGGVFDDMYQLATGIIDGTITGGAAERFLPVIYELDEADEWRDRSMWYKANPSLEPQGSVKRLDFLTSECERAEQNPVDLPGILCKDFNVRQSGAGAWLQFADIENKATFDLRDCAGKWAIAGVDLSKCGDLTCATLLMHDEGDRFLCHQMYWIPSDNVGGRIEHDKIPYDRWHEAGLVRYSEGGIVRTEDVTAWFLEIVREHDISIHSVWYDAWSATAWVDQMRGLGFRMVPTHQGAKTLSLPLEWLENALLKRNINYNDSQILLWCLTNAATQTDRNGNRVLCKGLSPRHRIDGAAALLDAAVGVYNSPDFLDL